MALQVVGINFRVKLPHQKVICLTEPPLMFTDKFIISAKVKVESLK